MAGACMEFAIEFEFLLERQNDAIVLEVCVASAISSDTFRFISSYKMADHGSSENGINCAEGHINYRDLHSIVNEAVCGFV